MRPVQVVRSPASENISVLLPAALAPTSATIWPLADREVDVAQNLHLAIEGVELLDAKQGSSPLRDKP